MTDNPHWTEAERLIVEITKVYGTPGDVEVPSTLHKAVDHGRRLIAECEPKLMTAEEACAIWDSTSVTVVAMRAILSACHARAFDVLDRKMTGDKFEAVSREALAERARCLRILAEVLKEKV